MGRRCVSRLTPSPTAKRARPDAAMLAAKAAVPAKMRNGSSGTKAPEGERTQRSQAGRHRRAHRLGREPDLLANEGVDRPLRVIHDSLHHEIRLGARETLGLVDLAQDVSFLIGRVVELVALQLDLVVEQLALRSDGDVLTDRHREAARQQTGHAGDDDRMGILARRSGHPHDQREVAHEPVRRAENDGPDDARTAGLVRAGRWLSERAEAVRDRLQLRARGGRSHSSPCRVGSGETPLPNAPAILRDRPLACRDRPPSLRSRLRRV